MPMPDEQQLPAVVVVGPLGSIVDVTDAACALLGYTKAELVRLHGTDLIPEETRPRVAVALDEMRRGGPTQRQGQLRRKNGSLVSVDVEGELLNDGRIALRLQARGAAG